MLINIYIIFLYIAFSFKRNESLQIFLNKFYYYYNRNNEKKKKIISNKELVKRLLSLF